MLAIKLVINTVIIYIKPIDAAFTSFKRDLTRKDKGIYRKGKYELHGNRAFFVH